MLRYLPQIITRKGNLSTEHEMRSQGGLAPNDSWIRLPLAWRSSLRFLPPAQLCSQEPCRWNLGNRPQPTSE